MKPTSILLSAAALFHLAVIDLTFLAVKSQTTIELAAVSVYNVIWLFIALSILSHKFHPSQK